MAASAGAGDDSGGGAVSGGVACFGTRPFIGPVWPAVRSRVLRGIRIHSNTRRLIGNESSSSDTVKLRTVPNSGNDVPLFCIFGILGQDITACRVISASCSKQWRS